MPVKSPSPDRRVVITGLGCVSPFGRGVDTLMDNIWANRSAVVSLDSLWPELVDKMTCHVGAPVAEAIDAQAIHRRLRRSMGRIAVLSYFAALDALEESGLADDALTSGRAGVSFGSTTGSVESLEEGFRSFLGVSDTSVGSGNFFQIMSHTCAANLAHAFDIKGRLLAPNAACASSTLALGLGYEAIKDGYQDIMLCGGADELHPTTVGSFELIHASSFRFNETPERTPRPFDKDRDGVVCGEGAGALVLESLDSARARGATIYGEIIGFATNADGSHLAQPSVDSAERCLRNALDSAQIGPDNPDYINAHGTGTPIGDASEAQAIGRVFGERDIPVSSLKGHLSHTLGASGALETIGVLKMMEIGRVAATLNLSEPDESCAFLHHVLRHEARSIHCAIKNSFAFGGVNSALVIARYEA